MLLKLLLCVVIVQIATAKLWVFFQNTGSDIAVRAVDSLTNLPKNWAATADYSAASEHPSNFGRLVIQTNGELADDVQTFAAGFLEGYLTSTLIYQHYANMMCQVDCSGYVSPELKTFFEQQDAWTRAQVTRHKDCPYWSYIGDFFLSFFLSLES
jgi:hypothetical protein